MVEGAERAVAAVGVGLAENVVADQRNDQRVPLLEARDQPRQAEVGMDQVVGLAAQFPPQVEGAAQVVEFRFPPVDKQDVGFDAFGRERIDLGFDGVSVSRVAGIGVEVRHHQDADGFSVR